MKHEWHCKTLGNGEWEPVVAPIACSYYTIAGRTVVFDKCSDPENEKSYVLGIDSFSVSSQPTNDFRWNRGEVITYVRSASPLHLFFLR